MALDPAIIDPLAEKLREKMFSLPSRYSMMSVSDERPPTSEKPARMFSTVTMKLKDVSGSLREPDVAMGSPR